MGQPGGSVLIKKSQIQYRRQTKQLLVIEGGAPNVTKKEPSSLYFCLIFIIFQLYLRANTCFLPRPLPVQNI